MYDNRKCFECGKELAGRTDKRFCDHTCRCNYHNKIYREEAIYVNRINKILKTNRKIIERFNPEGRARVSKVRLEKSGFDFDFFTHLHEGQRGRIYRFIYEYGYTFRDDHTIEIFIKKSLSLK